MGARARNCNAEDESELAGRRKQLNGHRAWGGAGKVDVEPRKEKASLKSLGLRAAAAAAFFAASMGSFGPVGARSYLNLDQKGGRGLPVPVPLTHCNHHLCFFLI